MTALGTPAVVTAQGMQNTGKLGMFGMLQLPPVQEIGTFMCHLSTDEDLIDIFAMKYFGHHFYLCDSQFRELISYREFFL